MAAFPELVKAGVLPEVWDKRSVGRSVSTRKLL